MHKVNLFQCIENIVILFPLIIYFLAGMIVGRNNSYRRCATLATTPIEKKKERKNMRAVRDCVYGLHPQLIFSKEEEERRWVLGGRSVNV
jgi:hypothetical protein